MNRSITGRLSVVVARPEATREAGCAAAFLIAALICTATITLPNLAYAHGGGGGFHGAGIGGFHGFHGAAIGSFHGGGLRGFHGPSVSESERGGEWHGVWPGGRPGGYRGWGDYDPNVWSEDSLYSGNNAFDTPSASEYWYCANPAGYYPNVTQCSVSWQPVPPN
jgi:hypothetical protein